MRRGRRRPPAAAPSRSPPAAPPSSRRAPGRPGATSSRPARSGRRRSSSNSNSATLPSSRVGLGVGDAPRHPAVGGRAEADPRQVAGHVVDRPRQRRVRDPLAAAPGRSPPRPAPAAVPPPRHGRSRTPSASITGGTSHGSTGSRGVAATRATPSRRRAARRGAAAAAGPWDRSVKPSAHTVRREAQLPENARHCTTSRPCARSPSRAAGRAPGASRRRRGRPGAARSRARPRRRPSSAGRPIPRSGRRARSRSSTSSPRPSRGDHGRRSSPAASPSSYGVGTRGPRDRLGVVALLHDPRHVGRARWARSVTMPSVRVGTSSGNRTGTVWPRAPRP